MTSPTAIKPPIANSPLAILIPALSTLIAISLAAMGLWRIGTDLDWAGDFVFQNGLLSHWQVWIAAAAGVQYANRRLAGRLPGLLDATQYWFSTRFGDRLLNAASQMRKVWNAVLIFPACSTGGPFVAGPHDFLNVCTTTNGPARIRRDQGGQRSSPGLRRLGVLHARHR
jgi:hypothetical protein